MEGRFSTEEIGTEFEDSYNFLMFLHLLNRTRNNSDRNPPGESAWTHGNSKIPGSYPHTLDFYEIKVWGYEPGILEHFPREFTRILRMDSGWNCSESDWVL
jgi:hypothetical protein